MNAKIIHIDEDDWAARVRLAEYIGYDTSMPKEQTDRFGPIKSVPTMPILVDKVIEYIENLKS